MTSEDFPSGDVLLVEDLPSTSKLWTMAFEEHVPGVTCHAVSTGEEAIEILAGDENATEFDLVLLDLDLPGKSGFEVLAWLDDRPDLRRLPVIVVSDTSDPAAVSRCYDLNARTFIPKPDGWDGLVDTVESIAEYWFVTAELPTEPTVPSPPAKPPNRGRIE